MYPEVCALLPDLKDDVLESYEEHHVADVLCMELAGMPAGVERFDAKASVLTENTPPTTRSAATQPSPRRSRTPPPRPGPATLELYLISPQPRTSRPSSSRATPR
jgi:hypothetical protein